MPKLKDLTLHTRNAANEKLSITFPVNVNPAGAFTVTIPDYLVEAMLSVANKNRERWPNTSVQKLVKHTAITGPVYEHCVSLAHAGMADYMACEVKRERVIVYSLANKVAWFLGNDGNAYPSGAFLPRCEGQRGDWHGGLNGSSGGQHSHYTIGFVARIMIRITHTRPTGSRTEWERDDESHSHSPSRPDERLNSFVGLNVDPAKCQWMPYSDEAAEFFFSVMMAMCNLDRKLSSFLANNDQVQLAIENFNGRLALGFDGSEK